MLSKKGILMYSPAAQKLLELAIDHKLLHLLRAIQLAIYHYAGIQRENGQDEVDHAVAVVWILWRWGIRKDEHLAKAMLHDLVEHGKEILEYIGLWFNVEIADDDSRLTRLPGEKGNITDLRLEKAFGFVHEYYYLMKTNWSFRNNLSANRLKLLRMLPQEYKNQVGNYYKRIDESDICVLIKNADKIDIFKNMAYSLPTRNQKLQIIEYEAFLAPMCKRVRKAKKRYLEAMFAGRDEIESLIENVIYQIYLKNLLDARKKELAESKNKIAELEARLVECEKP